VRAVKAARSGTVTAVDGWTIAGIARRAGAPSDQGAGLDLLVRQSDVVRAGDPLYLIYANAEAELASAIALADKDCGYMIAG
jgi:thymidine phosphorylase